MTATSRTPASLTWSGVTARRMARHALAEPAAHLSPAGMAGLLCGVHAQVFSAAELSIGRRIAGATRADVRRALGPERTLVKTFGPRGTVHLLPAADLPVWTGALSAELRGARRGGRADRRGHGGHADADRGPRHGRCARVSESGRRSFPLFIRQLTDVFRCNLQQHF